MSPKKIEPVYKTCGCGRRTNHHHILCDKCWRKKQKLKQQGFRTEPRPLKEYIKNEKKESEKNNSSQTEEVS